MRTNMPPKDVFFSFSNRWDDMLEGIFFQRISYHTDRHIYSHFVFTTVLFLTSFLRFLQQCCWKWNVATVNHAKSRKHGNSCGFYTPFLVEGLGFAISYWTCPTSSGNKIQFYFGCFLTICWRRDIVSKLACLFCSVFFSEATTLRLTLIPRMEFANGISRVSELLKIYPKEQTTKDRKWVVERKRSAKGDGGNWLKEK